MNKNEFEQRLEVLTPKPKEVLKFFLAGKSDAEISELIEKKQCTVRFHIRTIYKILGLSNDCDHGFKNRQELIDLFKEFKPGWVGDIHNLPVDRPGGIIPLDSLFYLQPDCENDCHREVLEPGALIRIHAPHQMGKTSLLYRVLKTATDAGCHTVTCNLRNDINRCDIQILQSFFRQFCNVVIEELSLKTKSISTEVSSYPTSKTECTRFFHEHILSEIDKPLVLAIDNADSLFEFPAIATDFFSLIRSWFDKARTPGWEEIWEKLRLIVVHATDNYLQIEQNQSPFDNVGLSVRLKPFQKHQVQDLAKRYQSGKMGETEIHRLMKLVGGHPFLIQQAFYSFSQYEITFDELLESAPTLTGIYRSHLKTLLQQIQLVSENQPEFNIRGGLKQLIEADGEVELTQEQTFILEGLGLVQLRGNQARISCELYRRFFRVWLYEGFQGVNNGAIAVHL